MVRTVKSSVRVRVFMFYFDVNLFDFVFDFVISFYFILLSEGVCFWAIFINSSSGVPIVKYAV